MIVVSKRDAAKDDLAAQWLWYAENASIGVADRFLATAEQTFALLATHPESGTLCTFESSLLLHLRWLPLSSPFESMLVFYLPKEGTVDVVRVIHQNRNIKEMLSVQDPV